MASEALSGHQPINEMNTTPLIDVMLVLLIMFIITIPIQSHSVPIDLPSPLPMQSPPDPVRNKLAIDADGGTFWNGAPIDRSALGAMLARVGSMAPQPELQLQPHPQARYETVDEVLAMIKRANVTAMGMVGNENYADF